MAAADSDGITRPTPAPATIMRGQEDAGEIGMGAEAKAPDVGRGEEQRAGGADEALAVAGAEQPAGERAQRRGHRAGGDLQARR